MPAHTIYVADPALWPRVKAAAAERNLGISEFVVTAVEAALTENRRLHAELAIARQAVTLLLDRIGERPQ